MARRQNPLGISWLWWLAAGAGAYYLYVRPRSQGRAPGVPEAQRIAQKARYEWQYFGKGADRDAVCRDRLKGAYVDDALCEKVQGPSDIEQLEGLSNYLGRG